MCSGDEMLTSRVCLNCGNVYYGSLGHCNNKKKRYPIDIEPAVKNVPKKRGKKKRP